MIERRRRERINVCLNQLKSLVLEALKKNVSSTEEGFPSRRANQKNVGGVGFGRFALNLVAFFYSIRFLTVKNSFGGV